MSFPWFPHYHGHTHPHLWETLPHTQPRTLSLTLTTHHRWCSETNPRCWWHVPQQTCRHTGYPLCALLSERNTVPEGHLPFGFPLTHTGCWNTTFPTTTGPPTSARPREEIRAHAASSDQTVPGPPHSTWFLRRLLVTGTPVVTTASAWSVSCPPHPWFSSLSTGFHYRTSDSCGPLGCTQDGDYHTVWICQGDKHSNDLWTKFSVGYRLRLHRQCSHCQTINTSRTCKLPTVWLTTPTSAYLVWPVWISWISLDTTLTNTVARLSQTKCKLLNLNANSDSGALLPLFSTSLCSVLTLCVCWPHATTALPHFVSQTQNPNTPSTMPLLTLPSSHLQPDAPTCLMTDAAVLQQNINGKWNPISFFSRKMTPAETPLQYLWQSLSIKQFRHLTNHKPLTYALNRSTTPRLHRSVHLDNQARQWYRQCSPVSN